MELSGQGAISRREGRRAIPLAEAQRRVAEAAEPCGTERVGLADAFGRRLAEPLVADGPAPTFARAGMDGFAVRAAELADAAPGRPVRLAVARTIASGAARPPRPLAPGEAARIMTGAPVPDGADAVVMLEAAREEEAAGRRQAVFTRPCAAGANLTPVGGEIAAGAALLPAGARIGPGEYALLAAYGRVSPLVFARPRAAILSTGSEVVAPQTAPAFGQIRNSNLGMLAGLAEAAGARVVSAEHAADDAARTEDALRRALAAADVVITSGGVSVGDFDVTGDLLRRPGRRLLFDKIAMRPGSVTSAAVQDGKLLLGLSGNPGACFVGFELLARHAIAALGGGPREAPAARPAVLAEDFAKGAGMTRYVRGSAAIAGAAVEVTPCGSNRSSDMVSIKDADCLIVIPPCPHGLPAGAPVGALPLLWRREGGPW